MREIMDALRSGRASVLDQRRAADRIAKLEQARETAADRLNALGFILEENGHEVRWAREVANAARATARSWDDDRGAG
jgi:hypothetical protein